MPQTELHRHLDVSIRPSTLLELAQERGLEGQSTSIEAFRDQLILKEPQENLAAALAKMSLFQKVLDRPEVLERVAFETVQDCWNEGTRKAELRYSPYFVSQYSSMAWEESLDAFYRGMQKGLAQHPDMKAGLICIASRDAHSTITERGVDFFLKNRDRFVGIDLAGNETLFPCRLFEKTFKRVRDAGARITIHAGEGAGPESIWEALECLGAQRIGHGVACVQDPQLMEYLRKNQICLELCPTSNWLTRAVPSIADHPLPRLLREGIPVSINTDDPGLFGASLDHEIRICQEIMGMSLAEIETCQSYASKASFIQ